MNTYKPQPIDLSDVTLPKDILELADLISKNVHEVWAENRIKEGWTYGEKRDDKLKTNPCLVPYEQLSDEEKAYDRNTAFETLKLITKLGYRLEKK